MDGMGEKVVVREMGLGDEFKLGMSVAVMNDGGKLFQLPALTKAKLVEMDGARYKISASLGKKRVPFTINVMALEAAGAFKV